MRAVFVNFYESSPDNILLTNSLQPFTRMSDVAWVDTFQHVSCIELEVVSLLDVDTIIYSWMLIL